MKLHFVPYSLHYMRSFFREWITGKNYTSTHGLKLFLIIQIHLFGNEKKNRSRKRSNRTYNNPIENNKTILLIVLSSIIFFFFVVINNV